MMVVLISLSGCDDQSWFAKNVWSGASQVAFQNVDVTGMESVQDIVLTDHRGKERTLADFKGKAVLVFFGYTHCPDVCPTTMLEMKRVLQDLGPLSDKVQVVFITLDPARDTVSLLSQYVPAFDARFLGMVAQPAALEKITGKFKIFYQVVAGNSPGQYTIDHTAGSYVIDPQGRTRLFVRYGQTTSLVHDLKLLLQ